MGKFVLLVVVCVSGCYGETGGDIVVVQDDIV